MLYYEPVAPNEETLELMRLIDKQFTKTPFFGARRIREALKGEGWSVTRKRIRRLMKKMGLEAIYPRPKTSQRNPEHSVHPYLLKGLTIDSSNQVWATDISYIPMRRGFLYLIAIMDWCSRYVLSWELSNSLDTVFCIRALKSALSLSTPEIFNSDQGSQFTALDFQAPLKEAGVRISMDGRGRWLDNVFVERLWRSLKYEEVYLHAYESVQEARISIGQWFNFYNYERPHQALGYKTPYEVYQGTEVERSAIALLSPPTLAPVPAC
jgi:putative transposase